MSLDGEAICMLQTLGRPLKRLHLMYAAEIMELHGTRVPLVTGQHGSIQVLTPSRSPWGKSDGTGYPHMIRLPNSMGYYRQKHFAR